ncbi:uncharacterized protein J4E79_011231 [Alternaria viburni]|uniref:uncharacterized protein n=1 Tax=Alternaria viburni TaxID=566460 RepID=UPI0020C405AB|nr:uncharacterized protein J4E79_011231 [Alternaria viburni]KAI4643291.1 hypothetical protein J4E79_011231 [Alternaria viburni]
MATKKKTKGKANKRVKVRHTPVSDVDDTESSPASYQDTRPVSQNVLGKRTRHSIPDSDDEQVTGYETECAIQALSRLQITSNDSISSKTVGLVLPLPRQQIDIACYSSKVYHLPFAQVLVEKGYAVLIDSIYEQEKVQGGNMHRLEYYEWRARLRYLFASVPLRVLRYTLDGSLARRDLSETDPDIVKHFRQDGPWQMRTLEKFAPAIYVRPFVDDRGESPTPRQFCQVAQVLFNYAYGLDLDMALRIDTALYPFQQPSTLAGLKEGRHYYLACSQKRALKVATWCHAIMTLADLKTPEDQKDTPMKQPRVHCGYSRSISHRKRQYDKHQSTTWLALLVESAFRVLFPAATYHFHTYPICFLGAEYEVLLAEQAMTVCTHADYKYGGFCVVPAGQCSSAELLGYNDATKSKTWEELNLWRDEYTPTLANQIYDNALRNPDRDPDEYPPLPGFDAAEAGAANTDDAEVGLAALAIADDKMKGNLEGETFFH